MRGQTRGLRWQILDFLYRIYPRDIEELSIVGVFYQYWTDKAIKQSLAYLVDSGYVEQKFSQHPYRKSEKIAFYKLTKKGVDLVEGFISDPAIAYEED